MSLAKILPSLQAVFFVNAGAANKRVGLAHLKQDAFAETFERHQKKFDEFISQLASDLKKVYVDVKHNLPEVEKAKPRTRHVQMYDEEEYEGEEGDDPQITEEMLQQLAAHAIEMSKKNKATSSSSK